MIDIALTALAYLLLAGMVMIGLGVALTPVYFWVRYRDSLATDEKLQG